MSTTILIALNEQDGDAELALTMHALLNARAENLCIDYRTATEIRSREDAGALEDAADDGSFPHGVEAVHFEVLTAASARTKRLIPGYRYLKRWGQTPQILGFTVKLHGFDMLEIDALNQALAALADTRRFTVEGEDEHFSYAAMLSANAEDPSFLAWMRDAKVGEQWLDGLHGLHTERVQ